MRFCNEIGIPHSKFLKEWEEEDRAKAIAYIIYDAQVCSMCGTAPWEWDEKQGGSRFAYEPVEEVCPGCERKDWLRDSKKESTPGGMVTLRRND
jgi:hypothetical protein